MPRTPEKQTPPAAEALLTFMAEYGRAYLSCGGPTSRLEEALFLLGRKLGYPTEVFATPTGIFVSCVDEVGTNHTTLSRIKDGGMNLGKLCWLEGIFEDAHSGKITLAQANKILHSKHVHKAPYKFWQTVLAAFLAGFAMSYPAFRSVPAALVSGFIATATWWISGPGLRDRVSSSIFRDFFGCLVTLFLAALFQVLLPAPFEAYSLGGLVLLVPGLTLTTAIAELADQNLVSGTAKLMQAVLTILALGLAYMLFQDLSDSLGIIPAPSSGPRPFLFGVSVIGAIISTSCFGILFRVPPKSLVWATVAGMTGWSILRILGQGNYIAASSYLASLVVGLLALWFGKRFKVPSQVYSVPGILALLPGMLALNSFRSIVMGQQESGVDLAFKVALTAGSVVFGLFTARIPFAFREKRPPAPLY